MENSRDAARRRTFDANAELYAAARPGYPDALIDRVLARTTPARALEIGAGPGNATRSFAGRGVEIVAVEPGAQLARLLRQRFADARVTVEETTFEAWDPAGRTFDLVYAAQSIHWIDPTVRYEKMAAVLVPGAHLAVIRNARAPLPTLVQAELDAAYAHHLPKRAEGTRDRVAENRARYVREIDASGLFGSVEVLAVPWTARYTTRAYLDLVSTFSDHAVLPADERAQLLAAIADVIGRHGGALDVPYVAMAFIACVES
jgi:trans-aconitate methyltransferase